MPQDPFGLLRGQRADDIGYFKASGEWVPLHRPTVASVLTHSGSEGGLAWSASPTLTNLSVAGWLRVGSLVVPTNTTAGHLTAETLWVPNQSSSSFTGLINGYSNGASVPFVSRIDASSTGPGFRVQGAAVIPSLQGIRGTGTIASPGAVTSAQTLVQLAGAGFYDGSNVSEQAAFRLTANENWSSTNRGTRAHLLLTPDASTTIGSQHLWLDEGFLTTGYLAAGFSSAPSVAGAGRLIGTDGVYPEGDANFYAKFVSSNPTYQHDANDYYDYDRTNNRHRFYVASTEMFRIDATAAQYKSYSVRATNSSGTLSVTPNTVTAVTFNAEAYDTGAMHDTGTNTSRLTAPVAGRYHVSGGVLWAAEALSTTTLLLTRISKNGTAIPGSRSYFPPISSIATNGQGQNVAIDIDLAANDYVELEVYFDAGASNRTITLTESSFAMHYIGGL